MKIRYSDNELINGIACALIAGTDIALILAVGTFLAARLLITLGVIQ
jgi:hypothetical protein